MHQHKQEASNTGNNRDRKSIQFPSYIIMKTENCPTHAVSVFHQRAAGITSIKIQHLKQSKEEVEEKEEKPHTSMIGWQARDNTPLRMC